jgi:hypothetical protein
MSSSDSTKRPLQFPGRWRGRALVVPRRPPAASSSASGATESTKEVDLEIETPKDDKATSLDNLSLLGRTLLMNAASLRVVRGQTHCAFCRGTGRETCQACQGSGLVQHQEKVRMNSVRHAASKIKVLLSLEEPKMSDDDWMKTNRCRRCHGTGALPCKHCGGTGRLGPAQ